jgi:multiple sugar transport system permease protein
LTPASSEMDRRAALTRTRRRVAVGAPERGGISGSRIALSALIALLALLTVSPLLWMLSGAFKGPTEIYGLNLLPTAPTLANFQYVLTQIPFPRYMFNSFAVAVVVTAVSLLFHSMAGYALARLRFPGREKIFFVIYSTLLVALPVILVPLYIVVRTLGMVDSYAGLIVPSIFNAFGIFLLRQFFLGIPTELEEAAALDNCGYWRIYWHVALPLGRPILAALAVFFFLYNWNSFLWPLTITNDQSLWMIQLGIASFHSAHAGAWNYVMAAATLAAAPTVLLFFVFQRQIVASLKTTGMK